MAKILNTTAPKACEDVVQQAFSHNDGGMQNDVTTLKDSVVLMNRKSTEDF